ncbi:MAG: LysR family transcriptional regulator [Burkholderiales bacterium]|jgi:DNA-binding transcriptional LysR family regulator
MNSLFDWSLVRSFLAVLEKGSLLAASRDLQLSQPTIGRHVAELESQLGLVLFDRNGRGLLPTEAAYHLAESARIMQSGADQLARNVMGADLGASGTVRITASQPVSCYVLPPLLAQMRLSLPDVQVELVASNEVSNLLRREADIAVRMVQPQQASIIARRVGKVTLRACAHQDYLRRRGVPRQPSDLLAHDLIGGDRNDDTLKGFAAQGLVVGREQFAFRADDLIVVWQAVRAGLGVGFVSEHLIRSDPAVIPVLPKLKIEPLPVWLAVHKEIRTSKRIRAVYDFLADALPRAI